MSLARLKLSSQIGGVVEVVVQAWVPTRTCTKAVVVRGSQLRPIRLLQEPFPKTAAGRCKGMMLNQLRHHPYEHSTSSGHSPVSSCQYHIREPLDVPTFHFIFQALVHLIVEYWGNIPKLSSLYYGYPHISAKCYPHISQYNPLNRPIPGSILNPLFMDSMLGSASLGILPILRKILGQQHWFDFRSFGSFGV